jgi:transposase
MTESKIVAFDLAKRIVQACVIDGTGAVIAEERMGPERVLSFTARHPHATVALEACGGAHHWGRALERQGHRVLLLPPQRVKSYGDPACKDDRRDARAIAEAASRSYLRPVPVKSEEQQALQSLDRVAALLARQRTQTVNALHGHLSEFGITLPKGPHLLKRRFTELEASPRWRELPEELGAAMGELFAAFLALEDRLSAIKARLARSAKQSKLGHLLLEIPGIGPMTAVSLEAAIGASGALFQRPAVRGLARAHATGQRQRRAQAVGAHHQAGLGAPAQPARGLRASDVAPVPTGPPRRPAGVLGAAFARAQAVERRGGGARQ